MLHTGNDTVRQLNVVEGRIAGFALSLVGNLMEFLTSMGYSKYQASKMAEGEVCVQQHDPELSRHCVQCVFFT